MRADKTRSNRVDAVRAIVFVLATVAEMWVMRAGQPSLERWRSALLIAGVGMAAAWAVRFAALTGKDRASI